VISCSLFIRDPRPLGWGGCQQPEQRTLDVAKRTYQEGDKATAIKQMAYAASHGNSEANYLLAAIYLDPDSERVNVELGIQYLNQSISVDKPYPKAIKLYKAVMGEIPYAKKRQGLF